jgi:hypothetical protein
VNLFTRSFDSLSQTFEAFHWFIRENKANKIIATWFKVLLSVREYAFVISFSHSQRKNVRTIEIREAILVGQEWGPKK